MDDMTRRDHGRHQGFGLDTVLTEVESSGYGVWRGWERFRSPALEMIGLKYIWNSRMEMLRSMSTRCGPQMWGPTSREELGSLSVWKCWEVVIRLRLCI